ncbi:hypothetical protein ACNOYE_15780 [Nannocystaceae bacterium ST9]
MSTTPTSERPLPRWSLACLASLHAAVFGWAAMKLPWSSGSAFTIVLLVLAGAQLATALTAATRSRALVWTWRIASLLSLGVLTWLAWELSRAASYLAALYGGLGEGIGAGLFAVIGLLALLTLPIACWGLAATWERRWSLRGAVGLGVLAIAVGLSSWREAAAAGVVALPSPSADDLRAELEAALPAWDTLPSLPREPARKGKRSQPKPTPSLFTRAPVSCVPDPEAGEALAVLTFLAGTPAKPQTRCVSAPPEALASAIAETLAGEALRAPAVLDVITGIGPLRSRHPLLDMLALRPGLDGACDDQGCLMPWQLVATEQFVVNEPLDWVPDFRLGLSPVGLRKALGQAVPAEVVEFDRRDRRKPDPKRDPPEPVAEYDDWNTLDGLARITTHSFTINREGRLIPLIRMHEAELELSGERLRAAQAAAEANIAGSQLDDGRFRYLIEPFSGRVNDRTWNLPRQAGTTLVMCEHGRDRRRTARVATNAAAFMAKHARASVDARTGAVLSPLSRRKDQAQLGSTALPALAMLTCRDRGHVGPEHDAVLVGMIEFLLAMQRDDGSFYPEWDTIAGQPIDGPEPMYAGGQVVYALSLAEKLGDPAAPGHVAGLPDRALLHAAIERAIAFYTGPYWDTFVRDFFFLEENWHCLAARASLGHHRNDAYEQFCLDYVAFKARVPLDEGSEVAEEFIGGYSLGNLLIPVNTPAAGHGEALAAAMAIKQARGLDIAAEQAQMRSVLRFLVRQQWNPDTCFACTTKLPVVGGFSESMGAPEVRIDYTQHAWAALAHGGALVIDELP